MHGLVLTLCLGLALYPLYGAGAKGAPSRAPRPAKHHPALAGVVADLLQSRHYTRRKVDDELSSRWLDEYLEALDRSRAIFLASDIAEFERLRTGLDDLVTGSDRNLDPLFDIYARYRQRVSERAAFALKLLDAPFDTSDDQRYVTDRSEAPWFETREDLDAFWRLRVEERAIRLMLRDEPPDKITKTLRERYERMRRSALDNDATDVFELAFAALARAFDPHSTYMKPANRANFNIRLSRSLGGVGARLRVVEGYTTIMELIAGGPAIKSGALHEGDRIVAVAQGDKGRFVDVVDTRIDRVVRLIRGDKGTVVRLKITPADAADPSETRVIRLVRDKIILTDRDAEGEVVELPAEGARAARKLGVITIPSFYQDGKAKRRGDKDFKSVSRDVARALEGFREQGVDGVLIDLRRNSGGSLDESIRLSGLFIDVGPVVQVKNASGQVKVERDEDPALAWAGPLVVLTSVYSASASEIFAAAMQDYGRAVVVGGRHTRGKGTVQNIFSLRTRLDKAMGVEAKPKRKGAEAQADIAGAVKLTTRKFYRISGGATQHRGVTPGVVLPMPDDDRKIREGDLDFPLPWDEIPPTTFSPRGLGPLAGALLRLRSARRVAASGDFQKLAEERADRAARSDKKWVSLNLEARRQELEALEGRHEAKKDEADGEDGEVEEKVDFIQREGLAVLRDLVDLERGGPL